MYFNISEIRQSVGDYRLLTSAELRMLIKKTMIAEEQRVELYRGLGTSARYLASRFITNEWNDKWLSFDVTETLQGWLKGTGGFQSNQCSSSRDLVPWPLSICCLDEWPTSYVLNVCLARGQAEFPAQALLRMHREQAEHVERFQFWHLWHHAHPRRHGDARQADEAAALHPHHVHPSEHQHPRGLAQKTLHRREGYVYSVSKSYTSHCSVHVSYLISLTTKRNGSSLSAGPVNPLCKSVVVTHKAKQGKAATRGRRPDHQDQWWFVSLCSRALKCVERRIWDSNHKPWSL